MDIFIGIFVLSTIYCVIWSLVNGDIKGAIEILGDGGKFFLIVGLIFGGVGVIYSIFGSFGLIPSIIFCIFILLKFSP